MLGGGPARPPDVNGKRMDPDDAQPLQPAAAQDAQRPHLVQAVHAGSRALLDEAVELRVPDEVEPVRVGDHR